jgi:hypothetical protein
MSDNVVKSTDLNQQKEKPVKKAAAKKTAPKKVEAVIEDSVNEKKVKEGFTVVVFESGSSYTSNGIRFTRQNSIQEIPADDASLLLQLDNFRLPNQFELEDYLNSKED